ncbi:putative ribonuclease H-like domain-containing protein [Tanacetum coccineum]
MPITTAEEKAQRRLEVKARSTLMMGIPNEHQLMFNSIKDAKLLLEAIEKRFGGNEATKKTQRNLLKQQYENFTAPSSEMLDQTFDRLQKLVSQLELLDEKLSQEDVNQKLLRSLSPEWNTHAVVWRNKADLDTMSMDDLYNNLKVTNEAVNTAHGVSTASTQVNVANSTNIDNLSDDVIYDIKEIDLRWQMAILTMRARRLLKNRGRKLTVNGNETIGFDKSKVECYNCHKRRHFARVNQDNKNKESSRRSMHVETSTSTTLVSCDGLGGYDWSDQTEEGPNYALMAFSSSSTGLEVSNDCICSKSCLKTVELLKFQNDQLLKDLKKSELMVLVPPPYTGNFMPLIPDLSFTSLDEFVNEPVVEHCKAMSREKEPKPKTEKKTIRPSIVKKEFVKSKQQEKTARKTVKHVEQFRQNTHNPRGNQRNWNNMMSQKLGSIFEMFNKACYVCGSFDHLQVDCNFHQKQFQNQRMVKPVWNNAQGVNHQNFAKKTHLCAKKNMVPRAVLMKLGLVSINTARQSISKTAVLVNTARQVNTAHSKTTVNAVTPMSYLSKIAHLIGNPQMNLQDQGVIDSGCSRHMTGNMSYLTNYKEIDGGYVAFGGNPKGGKITGKGTQSNGFAGTKASDNAGQARKETEPEVIEFGNSYKTPPEETGKGIEGSAKKKGRTVAITAEDMQKHKNDVKARTTLLLALPDEHQLRLRKYDTAKELLQAIVSHLEFMDVPIKQDDLNQKFLTSLAPEWLVYTINMAFISSFNTSSRKSEVSTAQGVSTASVQVPTTNTDVAAASFSYDTVCAFIATQPNGSQIKNEDITQINDDDIKEMDIKWNLALLSIKADRFWKKTGKKITIQGSDVAGFDKSKVECFNCHKMGHFARECRSPRSQDKGKKESYKKDPTVEEPTPKAMIAIDGIGWDWSYMAKEDEASNHALVANEEEVPTEYALMAKSSSSLDNEVYDDSFCSKSCRKNTENLNNKIIKLNKELSDCETDLYNYKRGLSQVEARLVEFKENEIKLCERIRVLERDIELKDNKIEYLKNELEEVKKEKESIDFKIEKFENASKDLDKLLGNQKLRKDKMGLGFNEYSAVPPPPAQVYSPPKKNLSWMGLPEFVDDTAIDYSRPIPRGSIGNVVSKPKIKFVKETGCPSTSKVNNTENSRKLTVKYAEMYRNTSQSPRGNKGKDVKPSACWIWKPKKNSLDQGIPQDNIDDKGYWDSGCSRHMTGNISYLSEYEPINGGYVSFGHGGGKITGKGTIKIGKIKFENVYFIKELKYNLFSVSQICDNKNSVLFTDSECLVLGKEFKLVDDTHVLLMTPRQQNMYSIDLKNIVPHKNLTCLIAKASVDECMLWHRRLGHLNFKTMNKLVRNNLVKGLPSKSFENNHTCVACLKGKQHKASCKTKLVNSISKPLHTLHMDLFGPTSVSSLNHKRCNNEGEFRNKEMDEFYSRKGIKREFSNARTPQQNDVAERRNRTLIEAARTMLADAKLPVTFWAEAVNTACYVQNKVLVNKSQNKTPYELFNGRSPAIGFLRPFGCHVMILNTLDNLDKFDAKGDEGTSSTNISGIKEDANQAMKENVKSDAFSEKDDSQKVQDSNTNVSESSRNTNPTATTKDPIADQVEPVLSSIVETEVPTVSSFIPTNCLSIPLVGRSLWRYN